MASLMETLKFLVVSSPYNCEWVLSVLEIISEVQPLSGKKLKEACMEKGLLSREKAGGPGEGEVAALVKWLLGEGILRRGSRVDEFEFVVSRDEFKRTISDLKEYLSDKVIIWEGALAEYAKGVVSRRRYFFLRKGNKLIRLGRLGEVIRGNKTVYLVIPRDAINDLVLMVQVDRLREVSGYEVHERCVLDLYWLDPELVRTPDFKGKTIDVGGEERKIARAEPNELLHYEVDAEDRIELDLSEPFDEWNMRRILRLANRLFVVRTHADKHVKICDILERVGRGLGYDVKRNIDLGGGPIDVVWFKANEPVIAFEVVLIDGVKEALQRLAESDVRKRFLVVSSERMEEVKRQISTDVQVISVETVESLQSSLSGLHLLKEFLQV
ncbi:MAG: hypothetical protein ACTSXJ_05020 [Candidatus Baldrarchaeia archaeon]